MTVVFDENLLGKHELDAVGFGAVKSDHDWQEDANAMFFRLDRVLYVAIENSDDGYRSMLDIVRAVTADDSVPELTEFESHEVLVSNPEDEHEDLLVMTDAATGVTVIEVGTQDYDDYYPCCVMKWNPAGLRANSEVET